MRFPTNSFFARVCFALIPFTILVTGLYTVIISNSIYMVEDKILVDYLQKEYKQFATQVAKEGLDTKLPSTSYLKVYWQDDPNLPESFKQYSIGYHELWGSEIEEDMHLLVVDIPEVENRIYMALEEGRFSSINQYDTLLDTLLISVAALVIIASILIATFIARRLTKPVSDLAEDVKSPWHTNKEFRGANRKDEIGMLSRAFNKLAQELQASLDKEKSFTRHASHEMRTPLAVIRNALSVLKLPNCAPEKQQRNLNRIEAALTETERMVDVFLCLGQDNLSSISQQNVDLKATIEAALTNHEELRVSKNIQISIQGSHASSLITSKTLTRVVIDNLLRNALYYGEQTLTIDITEEDVRFTNPISSSTDDSNSYGYGLEIISRICALLTWQFNTRTENQQFIAQIKFARQETH